LGRLHAKNNLSCSARAALYLLCMSPSTWADSSDAGSYGYGYDMSVPNMMPTGEMIPMVPASNWVPMSSEEATGQCSAEYQQWFQGFQACYSWMMAMQQGNPVYLSTTTTSNATDDTSGESSWMMAMQQGDPVYLSTTTTSNATDDASGDTEETEESEAKPTSPKPKTDAEKLSLESLLPPPGLGEASPIAVSLESMLLDISTPSQYGALKPKGLPSGTTGSMKDQLGALRMVNPAAVFIVRGIKPLGTPVVQKLQQYFSQFGEVTNVYAPHSRVKLNKLSTYQRAPVSRWRVANTGFVVMSEADSVAKVLELPEHNICGVFVSAHQFHRHDSVDPDADADADADDAAAKESTSASSHHDSGNESSVDDSAYDGAEVPLGEEAAKPLQGGASEGLVQYKN